MTVTTNNEPAYRTVDKFDKAHGILAGLPDVTHTQPTTVTTAEAIVGATQTFVIQTYRQVDRCRGKDGKEQSRSKDTVFLQYVDDTGSIRMVIPHRAIQAILRQHEALTGKVRRHVAREQAAARKARGEVPGFLKKKKG